MEPDDRAFTCRHVQLTRLEDEELPPRPGAKQILEWELRTVLDTSSSLESHPANRKAVCRVYLRELQQETGLSDDALQHVALVAGPRCAAALPVLGFRVKVSFYVRV